MMPLRHRGDVVNLVTGQKGTASSSLGSTAGRFGRAALFGSSAYMDFLDPGGITSGTQPITIAWRQEPRAPSGYSTILNWKPPGATYAFLIYQAADNAYHFACGPRNGTVPFFAMGGPVNGQVDTYVLVLAAGTDNKSGSNYTLFRNGVRHTSSSTSAFAVNTTAAARVGALDSGSDPFEGLISDLCIYSRALLDAEAASLSRNISQLYEQERRIWVPVDVASGGDTTISAQPAVASAAGVLTQLQISLQAAAGAAAATGVSALLPISIHASPGVASAAGVSTLLPVALQAGPGEATATGVQASISVGGTTTISATPGEASATGLTAQLHRIFGMAVGEAIASGVQASIVTTSPTVGRPVADRSNSGWSASTGSDLYAMVDEVTPDAADYIVATSVGAVCALDLNATQHPGGSAQSLKFRASSSTGHSVIVRLMNTGGAMVRSHTQALTASDTEYTVNLTPAEIAAITSGLLTVELEAA